MASMKDAAQVAQDVIFQGRCLYAAEVAALAVMAESGSVTNHQDRVAFCRQILNGGIPASRISWAVVTNTTVNNAINVANLPTDAGVTDAQLQTAVNSVLPAVAGIANTP